MVLRQRSDGRYLVIGSTSRPRVGMHLDGHRVTDVVRTWGTGLGEGGFNEVAGPDGVLRKVRRNPARVYGSLGRWSGVVEVE